MSISRSEEPKRVDEVLVRGFESLRGTPSGVQRPAIIFHAVQGFIRL